MNNQTINVKILFILMGIIVLAFWVYAFATIPDMFVYDMNNLERMGAAFMILMPFIGLGLIITGLIINDKSLNDAEVSGEEQ